ncbi:hypothetical protein LOD99_7546 [Oopsacas minuta]|uniref:Secreted protein n=1 Tax=Oopsacas minuta TaxID=111878 RepID=A0AAV7JQB8_9METZ|nr:hypothetical protein LOD99_7546 [Oopsacas minuta]
MQLLLLLFILSLVNSGVASQKAKGYYSWYRAPRIQRHPGTNERSNSVLAVQCLNTSAHLCKDNFLGTNIFCSRGEVVQPGRQPTSKNEKENVTGGHEEISIHQIPENVYHNNQEAGNCNRTKGSCDGHQQ